ncbi:hypothetical protein CF326_g4120 [Tilletia indica]|nr:hypothetical protein CF326_g4120 [Tilletia indica]
MKVVSMRRARGRFVTGHFVEAWLGIDRAVEALRLTSTGDNWGWWAYCGDFIKQHSWSANPSAKSSAGAPAQISTPNHSPRLPQPLEHLSASPMCAPYNSKQAPQAHDLAQPNLNPPHVVGYRTLSSLIP